MTVYEKSLFTQWKMYTAKTKLVTNWGHTAVHITVDTKRDCILSAVVPFSKRMMEICLFTLYTSEIDPYGILVRSLIHILSIILNTHTLIC